MNVLLVLADDRALGRSLRAALPESDLLLYEQTTSEALRRLIALRPDGVVLDDTPSLGRAALGRLREAAPDLPVLMLSSRGDADYLAGLNQAGARVCLAKPYSCEALRQAVSEAIRQVPSAPHPVAPLAVTVPGNDPVSRHHTTLRWLSRISGNLHDSRRLAQSLVDATVDIFDAVRSAALLELDGAVRVAASAGIAPEVAGEARFEYESGLLCWFERNPWLVDRSTALDAPDVAKELQVLGARLGVPLLCGGRVAGAVLIGDKASGLEYTTEDRELLVAVGRSASTCLENMSLYADVARHRGEMDGIVAHITAGVVVVRADRTVGLMNASAERILQLPAAEVMGRSVQKLGSGFADVVLRTLADRKPRLRQELRDPAINGRLGLSVAPLGDEGAVVIFSRLPDGTAGQENLAYSPFWEYLASRVAQEIKNPMVAINTFAQLLPRKYDSPDFRQAFGEVVQKEINRINNVVETLFDFARHPRLSLQPANLNETVRNVLRSFEEELAARSIEVETDWDPDTPDAELDPVTFGQALQNVLQNSIEAMPRGGTLRVRTRRRADTCAVTVTDSGPGIAEQDVPLVFMPFFSTKETGMGLGLTLANRIMKQHDGDLRLLNGVGGGSTFEFQVRAARQAHADHPGD